MIDRATRAEVHAAVKDFLFDRTTAFAFDERLQAVETTDETCRLVIRELWFYYDDVDDHQAVLDKASWDFIQRLLLLLSSDQEVVVIDHRRWHASQLIAVTTLAALAVAYWLHPEIWLPPVMLAGVVSMALSKWRARFVESLAPADPWRCFPFPSVSALRSAFERAASFRKARYRREIRERCIRTPSASFVAKLQMGFNWLLFSPIPLLFQSLPCRMNTTTLLSEGASGRS